MPINLFGFKKKIIAHFLSIKKFKSKYHFNAQFFFQKLRGLFYYVETKFKEKTHISSLTIYNILSKLFLVTLRTQLKFLKN